MSYAIRSSVLRYSCSDSVISMFVKVDLTHSLVVYYIGCRAPHIFELSIYFQFCVLRIFECLVLNS
jgi:hypothetical protein